MARGPSTSSNGQIQRSAADRQKPQENPLIQFIQDRQSDFAMVLPKHMTPDRMVRVAISAVRTTKGLDKCSLVSFASAIMACSALGLEPNTPLGHAYLIPYKGECTLVIGYKGLIELMYRSAAVSSVKATPVFEGDEFDYEMGLQPRLVHKPCGEDDPSKLTHVYTIVRWKEGGDPIWDVMTRAQIEKRRARSASAGSSYSPWRTDYTAMALKTGVRAIAKWVPSSTEKVSLAHAVTYDHHAELGRHSAALASLGEAPSALLEAAGVPAEEDPDGPDGVPADADTDPALDSDGSPLPGANG